MKRLILPLLMLFFLVSCSQNFKAHSNGGTLVIELEPGEKLVDIKWNGPGSDNLWYLVEPMEEDYIPRTKVFKEQTSLSRPSGKIIIKERRY